MVNYKIINNILRTTIIIGLVVIGMLTLTMKFGHCDKCNFELDGNKLNANEFMKIYSSKCLTYETNKINNYDYSFLENLSETFNKEEEE